MEKSTDVLVVGAGASGLTLACDLQRRGVPHLVVDAAGHGFEGSRAKGVQPRTLEVLDDLGVLPRLLAGATPYPPLGVHLGPVTLRRTMIKRYAPSPDVPHPDTLLVPQYATDASLRTRLTELGGEVQGSTRLVDLDQDSDGVVATLDGPGGHRTIRARYLVGADGGSSTVRKALGIAFVGTTDESDRMIVADLSLTGLTRDRWHVWPRHRGRFMALCPLPDGRFQLMLKLRRTDPADLDDDVARVIHASVGSLPVEVSAIHWTSVWRPNTRLAERYREGRTLLVGDAAHVHPPTGAQGLNTGVQDAYNLGWKLAQVLAGAPDALLDTYEAERRPVAGRVLGLATDLYAATGRRPLAATARGDEERQLTLSYRGGPLARTATTGRPGAGDRAPDAPYVSLDGVHGTLHAAFRGPHFTLVTLGDAPRHVAWPSVGAPLRSLHLDIGGNATLRRTYALGDGPAQFLVRPDGYLVDVVRGPASPWSDVAAPMLPQRP